jgi:hypothetical protein
MLTPKDFYGPVDQQNITADEFLTLAKNLGVDSQVLEAIVNNETRGEPSLPDGRPTILYEPYRFHFLTDGKFDSDPMVSVPKQSLSNYGAYGQHQYDRLEKAMSLNYDAALKSASWGFWQCMGANYPDLGYPTVEAFVEDFILGTSEQLKAFGKYLVGRKMVPLLQAKDWQGIANRFNGPGEAANNYAGKLKTYYDAHCNALSHGSIGPQVETVQKVLVQQGQPLKTDGLMGTVTVNAVKDFQSSKGLEPDGVVGVPTLTAMVASTSAKLDVIQPPLKSGRMVVATAGAGAGLGGIMSAIGSVADLGKAIMENHHEHLSATGTAAVNSNHGLAILAGGLGFALLVVSSYTALSKIMEWRHIKSAG